MPACMAADAAAPPRLLALPPAQASPSSSLPQTVYTVRLTTSMQRAAALNEPMAGINICLVGKDGRAILHRIPPVNDPDEQAATMDAICAVSATRDPDPRRARGPPVHFASPSVGSSDEPPRAAWPSGLQLPPEPLSWCLLLPSATWLTHQVAEPEIGANCAVLAPGSPGPALPPPGACCAREATRSGRHPPGGGGASGAWRSGRPGGSCRHGWGQPPVLRRC